MIDRHGWWGNVPSYIFLGPSPRDEKRELCMPRKYKPGTMLGGYYRNANPRQEA